jgi:ubiquinone/menaquinone biosynthesis C-methylase UbiE
MIVFRAVRTAASALGFHRLAWKLRKLAFAIGRSDLVLDAGGGAAPNPFANVVIDYDPSGRETNVGTARANGKALVWADVQRLPFRDRVFDYALCFHVIEHVQEPALAAGELQRVAAAGYIETPNELFDLVVPYHDHRNRVSYDGETLRIYRKARWDVERFEARFGRRRTQQVYEMLSRNPKELHVQYFWRGRINVAVSDEVIADGVTATEGVVASPGEDVRSLRLHEIAARVLRRRKLSDEELLALMRCVDCGGERLSLNASGARCNACARQYNRVEGFLDFRPAR